MIFLFDLSTLSIAEVGIIVGTITLLIHLGFCIKYGQGFDNLTDSASVFLAGASVVLGIRVCVLAFAPEICDAEDIEQVYIFLGGVAAAWVSIQRIIKLFRGVMQSNAPSNSSITPPPTTPPNE